MIESVRLDLYAINARAERFWKLFDEQQARGHSYIPAMRIAHAKMAPELRPLHPDDLRSVHAAIVLSEYSVSI